MKTYISPAVKCIDLSTESPLMSGSLTKNGDNITGTFSTNTTESGGLSNHRSASEEIWGFED